MRTVETPAPVVISTCLQRHLGVSVAICETIVCRSIHQWVSSRRGPRGFSVCECRVRACPRASSIRCSRARNIRRRFALERVKSSRLRASQLSLAADAFSVSRPVRWCACAPFPHKLIRGRQ